MVTVAGVKAPMVAGLGRTSTVAAGAGAELLGGVAEDPVAVVLAPQAARPITRRNDPATAAIRPMERFRVCNMDIWGFSLTRSDAAPGRAESPRCRRAV